MLKRRSVPPADRPSLAMRLPSVSTALMPAILRIVSGKVARMTKAQNCRNRRYLAAIALVRQTLWNGLIDSNDYARLEVVFAEKYRPLFRYEKPCFSPTLPITLSAERGA